MTHTARFGLVAACSSLGCLVPLQRAAAVPVAVGSMIFDDEMNGSSIDASKWSVYEPGVWGDGINSTTAASEANGAMKLSAYMSGGKNYGVVMSTHDQFTAKFGYYESRIQFNSSAGEWGAFWLNSPTIGTPIGAPTSAGVELDVVEHRAVDYANRPIANKYNTALHWDGYSTSEQSTEQLNGPVSGLGNGNWHTYGLLWTPTSYTMYMDDVPKWTQQTPISDTAEYMLLSTLIQNNTWAGTIPGNGYGSLATSTTNMLVDYVHVYDLNATAPEPASIALLAAPIAMSLTRRRSRA